MCIQPSLSRLLYRNLVCVSAVQFFYLCVGIFPSNSTIESRIFKSPTFTAKLSISHFDYAGFMIYLFVALLCVCVYNCYIFLMGYSFYCYKTSLSSLVIF